MHWLQKQHRERHSSFYSPVQLFQAEILVTSSQKWFIFISKHTYVRDQRFPKKKLLLPPPVLFCWSSGDYLRHRWETNQKSERRVWFRSNFHGFCRAVYYNKHESGWRNWLNSYMICIAIAAVLLGAWGRFLCIMKNYILDKYCPTISWRLWSVAASVNVS